VHGQPIHLDRFGVEPVEQRSQRLHAAVAGYLQGERLVVAGDLAERADGPLQGVRIAELQADARPEPAA